jgi:hypothetical protein
MTQRRWGHFSGLGIAVPPAPCSRSTSLVNAGFLDFLSLTNILGWLGWVGWFASYASSTWLDI